MGQSDHERRHSPVDGFNRRGRGNMAVPVQVPWRARWRIDHTASWPRQPRSRGCNIDINLDADLDAVPDDDSEHADDHTAEYGDKQTNEHADERSRQWCSSKLSSVEVVEIFSLTAIYKTKFLQSLLYCCCMNIYLLVCGELYYDEHTECPLLDIAGWTITDC